MEWEGPPENARQETYYASGIVLSSSLLLFDFIYHTPPAPPQAQSHDAGDLRRTCAVLIPVALKPGTQ